jgi:hypothetical protein
MLKIRTTAVNEALYFITPILSHFFILLAKLPNKVKNRYRLLFFHGCASGNGSPAPTA